MEKHSESRRSYLFAHLHLLSSDSFSSHLLSSDLFSSDSSHLCFSTVHIVGSFTSKLPSINQLITGGAPPCRFMFGFPSFKFVVILSARYLYINVVSSSPIMVQNFNATSLPALFCRDSQETQVFRHSLRECLELLRSNLKHSEQSATSRSFKRGLQMSKSCLNQPVFLRSNI